jgi:hypothetical protein
VSENQGLSRIRIRSGFNKSLDPDPNSAKRLDPKPDSVSPDAKN